MRLLLLFMLLLEVFGLPAFSHAQSAGMQPGDAAPAPVEIVKLEQNLWTTMADSGFAAVRNLLAPDFIEVDQKISAADALLINLRHCRLASYELHDLQVRILSPNSAMTAYHVVSSFDCGSEGKPGAKNYDGNSVTIWVRKPGSSKWLAQSHTESPAKP